MKNYYLRTKQPVKIAEAISGNTLEFVMLGKIEQSTDSGNFDKKQVHYSYAYINEQGQSVVIQGTKPKLLTTEQMVTAFAVIKSQITIDPVESGDDIGYEAQKHYLFFKLEMLQTLSNLNPTLALSDIELIIEEIEE